MVPLPTSFCRFFLIFLLLIASSTSFRAAADEISFVETYAEKLTPDTDVIWSGTSTLEMTLPWNGVNIEELDGNTEINISIGDFQFSRVLDAGEEFFEPGMRSARFRERDFDNEGNEVDILFVDVTWNTKTFSISAVFRNFSNAGEANFFGVPSHLDVPGSFRETNSADIAFGPMNASYPVVVSGRTTVSRKVVDEIEYYLNNIQLSGTADLPPNDTTPPSVSISSPSANGRLLTQTITGKASDDRGVAEVLYRIGTDEFALANGTTNWSVTTELQPGTNTIEVKSIDFAGNESPILARSFFYVVTAPLTLELNPDWGSASITNGQLLELNRRYSITANPAPGYLFQDWTGEINSTNRTLSFLMVSNLLLQANFIPNPFASMLGTYNGLFSAAEGVSPESAGYISVKVADTGTFSGQISLNGSRHSFSGRFTTGGAFAKAISRPGKPPLTCQLQFGFDGTMSGSVAFSNVTSAVEAELAQTTTNSSAAKYTMVVPPAVDPSTAPGGYGFGSAAVNLAGKIRFRGTLADNSIMGQSTMVSQSGRWPLFASHSRGKGVLWGWLTFSDLPDSDLRGDAVTWAKSFHPTARLYPAGFTNSGAVIGSRYLVPSAGSTAFASTNPVSGQLDFRAGNLGAALTNSFLAQTNGKFIIASTNKTALRLARSSGLLRGGFVHPDTHRSVILKGALLQKSMWGAGFFLGTNQSGSFSIEAAAE